MSNVVISLTSYTPKGTTLPTDKTFGYLLHDYELYRLSRPSINGDGPRVEGLPETVKVLYPKFMPMRKAWQFYWADLFSLSVYKTMYNLLGTSQKDFIKRGFASTTTGFRAFTNKHGWDDGLADYINDVNTDSPPMEQETIITAGNVVEILGDKVRLGGKDVYKVRTLDGNKVPPSPLEVNHLLTPWLVFKATISRREGYNQTTNKWNREDMVIPFPQLNGADVPIPFMGDGTENYIEVNRIKILPKGSQVPPTYVK